MLSANFHTHTYRCHHACGKDREYVECAIKEGIKKLGFSDHTPYFYDGDFYSRDKMRPEDLTEYVDSINSLKKEYADEIDIYCGLEVEYYPKYFLKLMELIKRCKVDYIILGQHYTNNETDGAFAFRDGHTESDISLYVDQVIEGAKSGYFSYIAHPEVFMPCPNTEFYYLQIARICECAKKLDIPLEFNLAGYRKQRWYPTRRFLDIASKFNNKIIFGVDAHEPCEFEGCQKLTDDADALLSEYNLKRTENIKLLNGKIV